MSGPPPGWDPDVAAENIRRQYRRRAALIAEATEEMKVTEPTSTWVDWFNAALSREAAERGVV